LIYKLLIYQETQTLFLGELGACKNTGETSTWADVRWVQARLSRG